MWAEPEQPRLCEPQAVSRSRCPAMAVPTVLGSDLVPANGCEQSLCFCEEKVVCLLSLFSFS